MRIWLYRSQIRKHNEIQKRVHIVMRPIIRRKICYMYSCTDFMLINTARWRKHTSNRGGGVDSLLEN